MRCGRDARERQRVVRIALARTILPPANSISSGGTLSCAAAMRGELVAQPRRRKLHGAAHRRARSGSSNCPTRSTRRPCAVSMSVMTRMSVGFRPNTSATTCASTVRWPCPCGTDATCTDTAPPGSSVIVAVACAPFFGPALRALRRRSARW